MSYAQTININQERKSRKSEQTAQAAVQQSSRDECTGACKVGQKELERSHGNADSTRADREFSVES